MELVVGGALAVAGAISAHKLAKCMRKSDKEDDTCSRD